MMGVSLDPINSSPIVTPKEIKETWCFGLPLTKDDGTQQSDADVQLFIDNAIVETQRKLGIFLRPTRIVANPTRRGLVEGADYDLEEPPYDYRPEQFRSFGFIQLRQYPIISVDRVSLVLPNGQKIVDFPKEWIKVYPKVGQVQIVPMSGSPTVMSLASMGSAGFALLNNRWAGNIPQALEIDYIAGLKEVPADIHNVVAKIASIDLLGIASDALLAGISSLSTSVDGMSESFTTSQSAEFSQYGSHIVQYQQEVGAFFGVNKTGEGQHAVSGGGGRTYYKGFTMTIL
jgi:hypothetical protein